MNEADTRPVLGEPKPEGSRTPVARFTVTMSGSQWSVATFGIVEFLRRNTWARISTAICGIGIGVVCVMKFIGFGIPYVPANSIFAVLFFVVPWLLWISTVSGPDFILAFPTQQASKEREKAEAKFEASPTPEDALVLDQKRLNEYYVINQNQARSSFRWAIFSMLLGLGTIITGIWLFYFKATQPDKFMASLSTAAGLVVNVISAFFLFLYSKTQDRSLYYYQQLASMQKFSMAMRLVDAHTDANEQKVARDLVIKELISRGGEQGVQVGPSKAVSESKRDS